jgi:hypothetical protein
MSCAMPRRATETPHHGEQLSSGGRPSHGTHLVKEEGDATEEAHVPHAVDRGQHGVGQRHRREPAHPHNGAEDVGTPGGHLKRVCKVCVQVRKPTCQPDSKQWRR